MTEIEVTGTTYRSTQDFEFFYEGLGKNTLLIQSCSECGRLRSPPAPMCSACMSFNWKAIPASGRGTIHSYVIHQHPPLPGFESPHPIGLIDLEEGVRFIAGLDGIKLDEIQIGLPVEAEFILRGDKYSVRFRRSSQNKTTA